MGGAVLFLLQVVVVFFVELVPAGRGGEGSGSLEFGGWCGWSLPWRRRLVDGWCRDVAAGVELVHRG